MTKRPTRRTAIVVLLGVVLAVAASTAQAGWLYVLAAGVLALVGASFLTPHRLGQIAVARVTPVRAPRGAAVRTSIVVRNVGKRRVPPFRLQDVFPGLAGGAIAVDRLEGRMEIERVLLRTATRRGEWEEGIVVISTGAPFGLVRSVRRLRVPSPFTVVPAWDELTSFPILEPSSAPHETLHERARTGAGQEFLGVREYRPGDSPRLVHWRSTARFGQLVVKELEDEAATPVTILLSGADHGTPPDSSFEVRVSAAASIAAYAIVTGHPVRMLRHGATGVEELRRPGRDDVLGWLASAVSTRKGPGPLVGALRHVRRGTVVVLESTEADPGELDAALGAIQAAGARSIAVLAVASTWTGGSPSSQEDAVVSRARTGRSTVKLLRRGVDLRECLRS